MSRTESLFFSGFQLTVWFCVSRSSEGCDSFIRTLVSFPLPTARDHFEWCADCNQLQTAIWLQVSAAQRAWDRQLEKRWCFCPPRSHRVWRTLGLCPEGQGNPFAADYSCDRGSREVEGKETENGALQMELKALGQSGVGFSYGSGAWRGMRGLVSPTEAAAVITPVVARGTESLKRQATLFFAMALPLSSGCLSVQE